MPKTLSFYCVFIAIFLYFIKVLWYNYYNLKSGRFCIRMAEIVKFSQGDILELKKPHPCGSKLFRCERGGSDIRIVCTVCKRDMTIPRIKLEKSIKKVIKEDPQIGKN